MAKTKVVPVRLPLDAVEALEREARSKGLTLSELLRQRLFPPTVPPQPNPSCPQCRGMVETMAMVVQQCATLLADVPPPDWPNLQWNQNRDAIVANWLREVHARLPRIPSLRPKPG